jgi:hypothetical protein
MKSPYKDVTDEDYTIAFNATKGWQRPPNWGSRLGDLGKKLAKRASSNFKELARLAKQNLKK